MKRSDSARPGLPFAKLHGAGNDFLLFDGSHDNALAGLLGSATPTLCDRRLGIGADGVLLVTPEDGQRVRVDYWNADGSIAAFCANGSRCAARFVAERWGRSSMTLATGFAQVPAQVEASAVRLTLPPSDLSGAWQTLYSEGAVHRARFVVVGVPHLVVPVEWEEFWTRSLAPLAPALRSHEVLGEGGANVNFVRVIGGELAVRSWERGVEGETLSCGSGDVAAALVAIEEGWLQPPVSVRTASARILSVAPTSAGPASPVMLEGPAEWICDGVVDRELLDRR